jgi:hypothetical protein
VAAALAALAVSMALLAGRQTPLSRHWLWGKQHSNEIQPTIEDFGEEANRSTDRTHWDEDCRA